MILLQADDRSGLMRVRVRLFAGTREAVGAGSVDLDVPEGARVDDVMAQLCAAHPRLAPYRAHALYAVDGAFVPVSARVAGKEIAIMPPVSGGSLSHSHTAGTRGARGTRGDIRRAAARSPRPSRPRGVEVDG